GGGHAVDAALRAPLGPAFLRRARRGQRAGLVDEAEGVEARIMLLDPRQRRLGHLDRRELAGAIEVDEFDGGQQSGILAHRWLLGRKAGTWGAGRRNEAHDSCHKQRRIVEGIAAGLNSVIAMTTEAFTPARRRLSLLAVNLCVLGV